MPWFRKKKLPRISFLEHAPEGLRDLHSHVLFGVDDGARSVDESVTMLTGLADLGFVHVVGTPHFDSHRAAPDAELQREIIEEITRRSAAPLPTITTGAEALFDERFVAAEAAGRVPSTGSTGTYLVEFGFRPGGVPLGVERVAFGFQVRSKQLIVAHPERCADFRRHPERLMALFRGGVLLQLDILSLLGHHGGEARETAHRLLEERRYDVASTDIHRADDLEDISHALRALLSFGEDEFRRLCSSNPLRIVSGEPAAGGGR